MSEYWWWRQKRRGRKGGLCSLLTVMHQVLEIDYLFLMLITTEVALTLVNLQLKGKLPTSLSWWVVKQDEKAKLDLTTGSVHNQHDMHCFHESKKPRAYAAEGLYVPTSEIPSCMADLSLTVTTIFLSLS